MDAIWQYLQQSPVLVIVLLVVVALIFSKVNAGSKETKVAPEDLVPHYKRFERREPELGNRRNDRSGQSTPDDRRKMGRRVGDWLRNKR